MELRGRLLYITILGLNFLVRTKVLLCSQLAVVATIGCWLSSKYASPISFSACLLVQQIAWNCAHAAHNALLSDARLNFGRKKGGSRVMRFPRLFQ